MGNCAVLSRQHPDKMILNLDIGGGTTNLALGQDRQVLHTGCLLLGARHVQVVPGSYRITKVSPYAQAIFEYLRIGKGPGDALMEAEVDAFVTFCISLLEHVCRGSDGLFQSPSIKRLEQVPFRLPIEVQAPVYTFSGGVGELAYRHGQGELWPPTTHFGDLGIDLAQSVVASPLWQPSLEQFRPTSGGRATVYGLLQHTTEVSGSTLFLRKPGLLPLTDLPILGWVHTDDSDDRLRDVLTLVRGSSRGGCVQVNVGSQRAADVRALGERLSRMLVEIAFPATQPLVLFVRENVGKVLGQYITRWGALPLQLLVIDEVAMRDAHYVQIGAPQHHIVPVSFYGLGPSGGDS